MDNRELVIYSIERCISHEPDACSDCIYNPLPFHECLDTMLQDAMELLKAQGQEISRLKHHVDCDAAEKRPSGCVGYGRGFNDDEPCETCKACPKYNGYEAGELE